MVVTMAMVGTFVILLGLGVWYRKISLGEPCLIVVAGVALVGGLHLLYRKMWADHD